MLIDDTGALLSDDPAWPWRDPHSTPSLVIIDRAVAGWCGVLWRIVR